MRMPSVRTTMISVFLLVSISSAILIDGTVRVNGAYQDKENDEPFPLITSPDPDSVFLDSDEIFFDGSSSWDPDGDAMSYLWYSDMDGYLGTEPSFQRSLGLGKHCITLQLSDGTVKTSTSVVITVEVDPLKFDTDRDGLPDVTDFDDDNDGLMDEEEDRNGNGLHDPGEMDPKNMDTDGDGIGDLRDEYPLDPYSPPPSSKDRKWAMIPFFIVMGIFNILFVLGIILIVSVQIWTTFRNRKHRRSKST